MGLASDPIYVKVSTHTQSPDGTTRNDTFYMTAALNAYAAQLAGNIATPVYNYIAAESAYLSGPGPLAGSQQYATPLSSGGQNIWDPAQFILAAGGPVSLRCEIGVGFQPSATPIRYHLNKWDQLSTPIAGNLTIGGQMIYNWIDGILQKMTYQNLYTGAPYTNG